MKPMALMLATLALGAGCLDPGAPGNLVPRTVAEDPTLPQVELNGTRLHAEAFGNPAAPTIIALHGGPGGDYRSMLDLKALADDGYRVVFWDNRGAGLSERHDGSVYTFDLYLEDLRQVVDTMTAPGQPFVFIGHSWGAMYATWFINEYGDYGGRLKGAILSDPGAFTKTELDAFMKRYMASVDLTGEQFNDALWSGQFMSANDQARADYLLLTMALRGVPAEHKDPAHLPPLWRLGAVASAALLRLAEEHGFDWTTHLKSFDHKVLFLRSDLDTAHTLESQQQMAAHYADADIITIPGVGHEMIYEAPAAYLAHARDYFRAIDFPGVAP
ncbi:MAG TPA: alpha/beta hydrolase [Polyangia bacterium]|nr:alpha/beta hydrolase [Polyangia bacterium]